MGILVFSVGGVALMLYGNGIMEKAVGVLSIAFFGGGGIYFLYAKSKGQGTIAIVADGIEMTMFSPKPRVIPWSDIEAIGTLTIATQEFTTIRLRNYRALLDGITDEEANRAVKLVGVMRGTGYAAIAVAVANMETDVGDLWHLCSGSGAVKSVADILQHLRKIYGAEILLGWNMRDRGAAEFAKYLDQRRLAAGDYPNRPAIRGAVRD